MSTIKTAVSLPEDVLAELDEAATEAQTSRSALVTVAVREYLRRRESEALTRGYDEVYKDEPLSEEDRAWLDFALAEQVNRSAEEGDRWPAK